MMRELIEEWDRRAQRPGLSSVMSTRWSEEESAAATLDLKTKIFGALGDLHAQKLLEVGSGIGRFTQDFQNAGASVVALDCSMKMIRRAVQVSEVPFINGSAGDLPLPTRQFDTSIAITVLQHITDPKIFQKTLDELKRVTKGSILICDELRDRKPEQVSHFTVLRTLDQFARGMVGWNLVYKDSFYCITDKYTLMVWKKDLPDAFRIPEGN